MARPKRDNELAARALVDAILFDDAKACERHEITRRTLQNYRKALIDDEELSHVFAAHLREATRRSWGDELDAAISDMLTSIRSTITSLESQTVTREEHLQMLDIKIGFVKMMLEPAITREILVSDTDAATNTKAPITA